MGATYTHAYCGQCAAPLEEPTLAEALRREQHCPSCGRGRACGVHEVNNVADSLMTLVGEHEQRIAQLELMIAKLQGRVDRLDGEEL